MAREMDAIVQGFVKMDEGLRTHTQSVKKFTKDPKVSSRGAAVPAAKRASKYGDPKFGTIKRVAGRVFATSAERAQAKKTTGKRVTSKRGTALPKYAAGPRSCASSSGVHMALAAKSSS